MKGRRSGGLSSQKIKWFCLACMWSVIQCQLQAVGLPPNIATKNPRGATVLQKVPVNRFLIYDKDREVNGWWIEDFRCLPSAVRADRSLGVPGGPGTEKLTRTGLVEAVLAWWIPQVSHTCMCSPSENHGAALRCTGWSDTLEDTLGMA